MTLRLRKLKNSVKTSRKLRDIPAEKRIGEMIEGRRRKWHAEKQLPRKAKHNDLG